MYMSLVDVCQDVLSASMEPNDSHYIERNKHSLGYVIELDDLRLHLIFVSHSPPNVTALYVRIILSLKTKKQKITYHLT